MQWPWFPPNWGDIIAIVLGVAIAIALILSVTVGPHFRPNSNSGFGPQWNCIHIPQSDPICFKH